MSNPQPQFPSRSELTPAQWRNLREYLARQQNERMKLGLREIANQLRASEEKGLSPEEVKALRVRIQELNGVFTVTLPHRQGQSS